MKDTDVINLLNYAYDNCELDDVDQLYNVKWQIKNSIDWRSFVPAIVKQCWPELSTPAMLSVYIMAYELDERDRENEEFGHVVL